MTRSPDDSISLAGQRWDWQAELYYYGARFYDPRLASFLTHDPVREYSNPYAYVGWNPVSRTDPTGMFFGHGGLYGMSTGFASLGYFGDDYGRRYGQLTGTLNYGAGGGGGGAFIQSSASGFDQSFSFGGIRIGGFEAGASASTPGASGGLGGGLTGLGIFALAFALPFAVVLAATAAPGALVGGVFGAFSGFIVGGISTGSLSGALAGAGVGAALGAFAGSVAPTGVGFIALGALAGFASAGVTAFSQLNSTGSIDAGAVAASFALGVTTGWIGGAFAHAYSSPILGATITGTLDAMFAAVTTSSALTAPTGGSTNQPGFGAIRFGVTLGINLQTGASFEAPYLQGFGTIGPPGVFGEYF
jgi:RHS repeat-associated protein